MLSFVTLPTRSTFTTRPSAGDTITRGSDGTSRFGFLKKNATKAVSSSRKSPAPGRSSQKLAITVADKGSRNLYASLTIILGRMLKKGGRSWGFRIADFGFRNGADCEFNPKSAIRNPKFLYVC